VGLEEPPGSTCCIRNGGNMLTVPHLYELHHIIFSVFFLVIILNGATYHLSFFPLENKVFYSLGTISYGMYLWHPLCIGVSLWFMKTWGLWAYDWGNVVYYIISITLTIIIAHYSYYYFEKIFLRIKRQYTVVRSGEEARKKHEPQLEPA
jgi:peptidoglycan/LPS O-acetylase OafA/YrhL